jgi:hypothetical protein
MTDSAKKTRLKLLRHHRTKGAATVRCGLQKQEPALYSTLLLPTDSVANTFILNHRLQGRVSLHPDHAFPFFLFVGTLEGKLRYAMTKHPKAVYDDRLFRRLDRQRGAHIESMLPGAERKYRWVSQARC